MKLMSTYGGLVPLPNQKVSKRFFKESNGRYSTKSFTYTETFANHYLYWHAVDDHNNLRHSQPSIESTWITHRWVIRVFSFILAISEVNTFLAFRYFVWKEEPDKMTLHQFRRKLALSLINNEYLHTDEDGAKILRRKSKRKLDQLQSTDHVLLSAPPHAKKIYREKWQLTSKAKYQQFTCKHVGCSNKTRNYCKCNPGYWICRACHPIHITYEISSESGSD